MKIVTLAMVRLQRYSQHLQKVEGGEAAEGVRLDTLDLVGVYKSAEIVSN